MDYLSLVVGIILINLLLSGDNALVIALASRELSPKDQNKAMFFGSLGAIVLRVILTLVAVLLLRIAYLQLFAGAALLWIAVKLATEKDIAQIGKSQPAQICLTQLKLFWLQT